MRTDTVLDDDVRGALNDAAAGARSVNQAVTHVLQRLDGRAPLAQVVGATIVLVREQQEKIAKLRIELNRVEVERDDLREDLEARAAARRLDQDLDLAGALAEASR